jgi:hypothetical protein
MNTGTSWRDVTIDWSERSPRRGNGPTGDLKPRTGNGRPETVRRLMPRQKDDWPQEATRI